VSALPSSQLVATWGEKMLATSGDHRSDIKAAIIQVNASGTQDFLSASGGIRINTEINDEQHPESQRDRDLPCAAAMGERGEFIAFAWVEQKLAPPFSQPALKARIVSRDLT